MIVGIGDNCVDVYEPPIGRRFAGGNVLNVVANCLLRGVPALYAGTVGDDPNGRFIQAALRRLGADDAFLHVDRGGMTGVTRIRLVDHEPLYLEETYGVSGDVHLSASLQAFVLRQPCIIHLSTNARAGDIAQALEPLHRPLSCDFGTHLGDPSKTEYWAMLPLLDYAFVSVGAETSLAAVRELTRELVSAGPPHVVVTRGAAGCYAWWAGEEVTLPALPLPIVDTLGAGDALIAGVLAYSERPGHSAQAAIQQGLRWAAEACGHIGAWPQAAP